MSSASRKRVVVIDMKQQLPARPEPPPPPEFPACARPQGLPPTLKASIGDRIAKVNR